ncbi:hypothetical protein K490DRAFT_52925 [Saccharata proteae CBS 121410]|uniref:Uncharacterized protein n=1 Tax=Saccharata proteae CBS 121410 TaxID=1314787 RepID=A0A9P4M207_9PEZI|nr:hypothetical protein K490DRAFT_52925 [Saccharata proteae CBS 121410]
MSCSQSLLRLPGNHVHASTALAVKNVPQNLYDTDSSLCALIGVLRNLLVHYLIKAPRDMHSQLGISTRALSIDRSRALSTQSELSKPSPERKTTHEQILIRNPVLSSPGLVRLIEFV